MLLGLVSDTHDDVVLAARAAVFFRQEACGLVLHLGDITDGATVGAFAGLPARFLCGNNDDPRELAPALLHHGFPALADDWRADVAGIRIVAHHGHRPPPLRDEPQLLVHGHTHQRRAERIGRSLVVNPGALHRARVRTVALVELPSLAVRFYEVTRDHVAPLRA